MAETAMRASSAVSMVTQFATLTDAFGGLFARTFPVALASFIAELHRVLEARGTNLGDLDADELAALSSRYFSALARSPYGGESAESDLSSAPEWVRRAYERSGEGATAVRVKDSVVVKKYIRNRLLMALKAKGMTQAELAKKLGKSDSQISRILAKPERSKVDTLTEVAAAIGVDLSDVVRNLGN